MIALRKIKGTSNSKMEVKEYLLLGRIIQHTEILGQRMKKELFIKKLDLACRIADWRDSKN